MSRFDIKSFFSKHNDSRDDMFDILKGIAIIFVIMGHCGSSPLRAFIFSFHMPLFFFITGYFLKIRPIGKEIGLNFKRLIVPYIFSSTCILMIVAIRNYVDNSWADISYTKDYAIKFLFGFKGEIIPNWLNGTIMTFWFIWAMFWARGFVVLILKKIESVKFLCVFFFFFGPFGVFLGENFAIPYCIPLGITATGFVYVGYLVRQFKLLESANLKSFFPFLLILWLYNWWRDGMDMARFLYPSGYVFFLLGALGAFIVLFKFVESFQNNNSFFWQIIRFCGRYSLVIYCIHAIDENLNNWGMFASYHHVPVEYRDVFQLVTRLLVTFTMTLVVLKIKPLREGVFQIKD